MTAKKKDDMEVRRRIFQAPNPECLRTIITLNRSERVVDGVPMPALTRMLHPNKLTGQFILNENEIEYDSQLKAMRKACEKWGYVEVDEEQFGKPPKGYKPEIKDPELLSQEIEDKDRVIESKDKQIAELEAALKEALGSGADDGDKGKKGNAKNDGASDIPDGIGQEDE